MKQSFKSHARVAALMCGTILLGTGSVRADQVIPDDLIVQGSLCVGFDCVNGESFGVSTIRLKENNTRIEFMDTSVGAFPANDWMITANDQGSGGASYLAFDDITGAKQPFRVTAGAPTASLFVDSTGRVGLRTSAPLLDLHMSTGNTPAIRLEQSNSSGFTAQTWDVGGNEANFFVRDLTGGSRLPFRVRPGAPTSSIDIAANGNVGIGNQAPSFKLDIQSSDAALRVNANGANQIARLFLQTATRDWRFANDPTQGDKFFLFDGSAGAIRMSVDTSGNFGFGVTAPAAKVNVNGTLRVGTLNGNPAGNTVCFSASNVLGTCASDERLKHNVRYMQQSAGLDAVMKLKPATYQWHDGDERVMAGFVAQEAKAAIPEAVHQPAGSDALSLDSAAILSYTVKAIQELKADNDRLRGEIERLKTPR